MYAIAIDMRGLHEDNIHEALKASNVLILVAKYDDTNVLKDDLDPHSDEDFEYMVVNFECSIGVMG